MSDVPVFVTVSVTRKLAPRHDAAGMTSITAARTAGVFTVVIVVALTVTPPHALAPASVIVKVTGPAPVAV